MDNGKYRCAFCGTVNPLRHDIICPKYRVPKVPEKPAEKPSKGR